ncbi:hypothetical protein Tco_0893408 [Tanacetum coccineum]|uniref:Reverse transcriptase domain-containing protein n=1 Tax=Tanacetum coccineum TaxID=301880 RepID=A0ABQ5C8V5_9ASTR
MIKEHDQQAQGTGTPRRLTYDFDREALKRSLAKSFSDRFSLESSGTSDTRVRTRSVGLEGTDEDLSSPYKRPKPTPFTTRITCFNTSSETRLPRNIKVYDGNKDPKDHLGNFLEAAKQEEWLMPVWCKMFCQTLGGAAPKKVRKGPPEIHGIKRRQNEGLQAFMDPFKFESSHIKGVLPVLRISAFMHGHGHPKLAKKAQ